MASVDVADWATLRLDDPLEHHLFSTPFGEIDVLPQPFGRGGWGRTTGYDELRSGAITVNAFGLSIPVAAFEDIAAAKLALGREQDREAEAELRRVGRLLARGDHPGYGLEEFAEES
jgi:hypothetical protein